MLSEEEAFRQRAVDEMQRLSTMLKINEKLDGMRSIHLYVTMMAFAELAKSGTVDFEALKKRVRRAYSKRQDHLEASERVQIALRAVDSLAGLVPDPDPKAD